VSVLNLSDAMKFLSMLKGSMSLVVVAWHYGKNESSIQSMVLNSKDSKLSWFFLSGGLFGTTYSPIQRVCCIFKLNGKLQRCFQTGYTIYTLIIRA
jgi:hypothetical protein